MNNSNNLFIISTILVFTVVFSVNYDAISDYYRYSLPLNTLVLSPNFFEDNQINFQEIYNDVNSDCFTTPNENLFCYKKPRDHNDGVLISYVVGENGIDGEMHFDSTDNVLLYFTMQSMTQIKDDTVMITFADKDYRVGNATSVMYEITDEFEFSAVMEKFDTFIAKCNNYEGTSVTIVQYLGITTIDDVDYFMTWHTTADSESGVTCDYPQIIKYSIRHDFGI